jgi:hypothetical protein
MNGLRHPIWFRRRGLGVRRIVARGEVAVVIRLVTTIRAGPESSRLQILPQLRRVVGPKPF